MSDHTRVTFKTFYHAESPDRVIAVVGSTICLGSWDPAKSLILTEDKDTGAWKVTTKLQVGGKFDWKFAVIDKRNDRVDQWEDIPNRFLLVGKLPIEIEASWNGKENIHCPTSDQDNNQPCVIINSATRTVNTNKVVEVKFKINFVANDINEVVAIAGGGEALGSWNPENALVCESFGNENCRTASVHLAQNAVHEWKLVCLDKYSHHILRWEDGRNRRLYVEQFPVDVVAPWNVKEVIRYSRPTNVMFTPLERKSSDLDCSKNTSNNNINNNNNSAKNLSHKNEIANVTINVLHDTGSSGFVLCVSGSCEPLGYWDTERALRLIQQESGQNWRETFCVQTHSSFEWKLLILNKGVPVWESRPNRFLEIKDTSVEVTLQWNGVEQIELLPASVRDLVEVSFKTEYSLEDNEVIAIAGSSGTLGAWDTREALVLDSQHNGNHWSSTTFFVVDEVVEWKLVVLDKLTLHVKRWEESNNRLLRIEKSSLEVVVPWGKREAIREVNADPKLFLSEDGAGICSMCKTCCQQESPNWQTCSHDDHDGFPNTNKAVVIDAIFRTNYCLDNFNTSVAIAGSCYSLGRWNLDKAVLLQKGTSKGDWETVISLPINEPIEWKMLIIDKITRKALLWEDRENRSLTIKSCGIEVNVDWNSVPSFKHVPSQSVQIPTCKSCGKYTTQSDDNSDDLVPVTFKTDYYCHSGNCALAVIGSPRALGCWCVEKAAVMTCETKNSWETMVSLPINTDVYWKLVTIEKQTSHVVRWEDCDNRFLKIVKFCLDIFTPWNNKEICSNTKTCENMVTDLTSDKLSSVMKQTSNQLKVKKSVHFASDPVAEYKVFTENQYSKQTCASYEVDMIDNFLE